MLYTEKFWSLYECYPNLCQIVLEIKTRWTQPKWNDFRVFWDAKLQYTEEYEYLWSLQMFVWCWWSSDFVTGTLYSDQFSHLFPSDGHFQFLYGGVTSTLPFCFIIWTVPYFGVQRYSNRAFNSLLGTF